MVNVNCLPGCCCIICYRDGFNRPDNDVVTDAPIAWAPPGLYVVESHRLRMDWPLQVLQFDHEIPLGLCQLYQVKIKLKDLGAGGQVAIFVSFATTDNCFACVYDGDAMEIFYVGGPWPTNWTSLNRVLSDIPPDEIRVTVSLIDWLMEMAVVNGGAKETCVAPYFFNGGTRVGVGVINGDIAPEPLPLPIIIDDFSLCENLCLPGCIYGADTFDRTVIPNNSLGNNWQEHESSPGNIKVVAGGPGTGGGIVKFDATSKMFWKHPHPDDHQTMGVMFRLGFVSIYEQSGVNNAGLAKVLAKPVTLYACVDDPVNPTEWIAAKFEPHNGHVTLSKTSVAGGTPSITQSGSGFPSGISPNQWVDLYLCVTYYGRVTAYAKSVTGYAWQAGAWAQMGGLNGRYCGIECYGSTGDFTTAGNDIFQFTLIDQFAAIKTFHPGLPQIVEWTIGGTIEANDKFVIGATKDGFTETLSVTADSTDPAEVAHNILMAIMAVDIFDYQVLRSLAWYLGEPGKIRAQAQAVFTGTAETTEFNLAPSDGQTFTCQTLQLWVKGAYNCPDCPPVCGPCLPCESTPPIDPPETETPLYVELVLQGTRDAYKFAPFTQGETCMSNNGPGQVHPNPYHPFPNFPDDVLCLDDRDLCKGFSGTYILEGCDCGWSFWFPPWYNYYYPDGGPITQPDNDWYFATCYPGLNCDGFKFDAQIRTDYSADPFGGMLYWYIILQTMVTFAFWRTETFPRDQCRYPRTAYWFIPETVTGETDLLQCGGGRDDPPGLTPPSNFTTWPDIQVRPIGTLLK